MEERAFRGIPWMLLAFAGRRVMTLATTIVLARILVPSDFGIVALATLAIGTVTLANDLGLGGVFVVRQDLDDRGKGTVLTLMLVGFAVSSGLLAAFAGPIAGFFREPRLADVLRVLAAIELLGGITWFYENAMIRELEFRKRSGCELMQAGVLSATSIGLAIAGAGYWSIVGGIALSWAVYTGALVIWAPYRVRPALDLALARDLISSGRGFLVQSAVAFLQTSVDYLAVGRLLGTRQVGFYSMAYRLAEQSYWAIADAVGRVTFPGFARMRHRGEEVTEPFLRIMGVVFLASCPIGVLLSAAAGPFTQSILGDRWLPMVDTLMILGLWAAVRPLQSTMGWFLSSQDRAGLQAAVTSTLFVALVPSLLLAADRGGISAVAGVMLGHSLLSAVLLGMVLSRYMGVGLGSQWRAVRSPLIAGVLAWAAMRALVMAIDAHTALVLIASVATGAGVYLVAMARLSPGAIRHLVTRGAGLLRRADPSESASE